MRKFLVFLLVLVVPGSRASAQASSQQMYSSTQGDTTTYTHPRGCSVTVTPETIRVFAIAELAPGAAAKAYGTGLTIIRKGFNMNPKLSDTELRKALKQTDLDFLTMMCREPVATIADSLVRATAEKILLTGK